MREKDEESYVSVKGLSAGQRRSRARPAIFRRWSISFKLVLLCVVLGIFGILGHRKYGCWIRTKHNIHGIVRHPLVGKAAEKLFLSVPNELSALEASRQYATKPHLAGSPSDFATANIFLELLQKELNISSPPQIPLFPAGSPESRDATLSIPTLDEPRAWIDIYYPVMNTPLDRSVEILGDDGKPVWKADLREHVDPVEPVHEYADDVPTFHGLSRGGEVEGMLVYAHYGRKDDYDALIDQGVDLNGKIVIARYGGIFRGLKVKGAQERGASGVLIYSDPRDDGTVTSENGYTPYPHGPARNPTSVQRGSVQFISLYPGDPTTPGYPSYENSTRTEGLNIPSIPSLPISWENAKVLLQETGKQGRRVKLVNHVDEKVTPIWNTLGVIPGHIKDEVVMIGNHRDAWVMGATDPSSGTASVHEIIRSFGILLRNGWKPLRTILIASWDAEEYGLIGSTEWGEDFSDWISNHVVAYLNLDSSVSGSQFRTRASPSLAHLIRQTAQEIAHPTDEKSGRTLWDATNDSGVLFGDRADGQCIHDAEATAVREAEDIVLSTVGVHALGSGSDYTVFLQRIGVASTDEGFGSTSSDPVYHYHSVFDSERWQEVYGDPGFFRHVAVAKHLGLMTLRFASSIILPINTTHYAYELETYLDQVERIVGRSNLSLEVDLSPLRESIQKLQTSSLELDLEKYEAEHRLRHIIKKWKKHHTRLHKLRRKLKKILCRMKKIFGRECTYHDDRLSSNRTPTIPPDGILKGPKKPRIGRFPAWHQEQQEFKELDLANGLAFEAGLDSAVFTTNSDLKPRRRHHLRKLICAVKRVQAVNKKLIAFERGFISESGIKDREWYRHLGVAPGKWLGYGATTLPALTESITYEQNATLAEYEAGRIKQLIDQLAEKMRV